MKNGKFQKRKRPVNMAMVTETRCLTFHAPICGLGRLNSLLTDTQKLMKMITEGSATWSINKRFCMI